MFKKPFCFSAGFRVLIVMRKDPQIPLSIKHADSALILWW